MNREQDFEQTVKRWLDDGADHAPERFIWAALDDVERTAQRGAWRVSLEELLMNLKPAALVLGTAAVIIVAIAAYQLFRGSNVGGPSEPTPTPQAFTPADLPNIILTEANAPAGLTVDATDSGAAALVVPLRPGGPFIDQTAFVDALMTNLNSTETGGYVSWSALFETAADAEVAFDYLVDEHGSAGWGMTRSSVDPGLGEASASFTGAAYDIFETNGVHLWRVDNLVLAAVGVGDYDTDQLRSIADLMDERAHSGAGGPGGADSVAGLYTCNSVEISEALAEVWELRVDGTLTWITSGGYSTEGIWSADGDSGVVRVGEDPDPFTIEGDWLVFAGRGGLACTPAN